MYNETHQVQIALITKCDLYAHGSLFASLYLGANITDALELEWYIGNLGCTMKLTKHRLQNTVSMLTVPCSLYCVRVSISADALELEWCTGNLGCTMKLIKFRLQNAVSTLMIPCSFCSI